MRKSPEIIELDGTRLGEMLGRVEQALDDESAWNTLITLSFKKH